MHGPKIVIHQTNNDSAVEIIQTGNEDAIKVTGNIVAATIQTPIQKLLNRSNLNFSSTTRWEQIAMSSAQGGATITGAYHGCAFDGRYIYFSASDSVTFIRYDTTQLFSDITSWTQYAVSSAQGGAVVANAYRGMVFDGKYVYFIIEDSSTFIRYDTGKSFTSISSWEQMPANSAIGNTAPSAAYQSATFDGRYLFLSPVNANTLIRFDTAASFTSILSWTPMAISSGLGAASPGTAFCGISFDSRYVYFAPANSDTFIRYDTTTTFDVSSSWSQIAMSSAQGGAALDAAYTGVVFDGHYMYFAPSNSDTFIRYDTTRPFTSTSSWQQIAMNSVQGDTALDTAYLGTTFDGRYVYFSALNSDTMVRFDTTESFTGILSWEQVAIASAQNGAAVDTAYNALTFDGYYVYFVPENSATIIRFRANNSVTPGLADYAQISTV
jgi:hypothetical protein